MTKRIRNIFAATMVSLLCVPVAVCGVSAAFADDSWSPVHSGAYLWDGNLAKAGWLGNATTPDTYEIKYVDSASDGEQTVASNEIECINIHDASALAYFAYQVSLPANNGFEGITVNLTNDIDLGGDDNLWIPIGFDGRKHSTDGGVSFKGTFDGNGHTVYNLSSQKFYDSIGYNSTKSSFFVTYESEQIDLYFGQDNGNTYEYVYGLFGNVGNATIKNLTVADVKIDLQSKKITATNGTSYTVNTDCVGAIAGYAAGDLTLIDCTVGSADSDKESTDYINHTLSTGGLVGRAYAGKKDGAPFGSSTVVVIGKDSSGKDVQGATLEAGQTLGSVTVENCVNYLNLGTDDEGDKFLSGTDNNVTVGDKRGGLIGYVHAANNVTIKNSENYGDIIGAYAGGAVSYIQPSGNWHYTSDGAAIDYAYNFTGFRNYGTVSGVYADASSNVVTEVIYAGGMFGRINDAVTNYSKSSVTLTGASTTSTFTSTYEGAKTLTVKDCINYGTITCANAILNEKSYDNTKDTVSSLYVGGLFGYLDNNKNSTVSFTESYNYGDILNYELKENDFVSSTADKFYTGGLVGAVKFDFSDDAANSTFKCGNVGKVSSISTPYGCLGVIADGNLSYSNVVAIDAYLSGDVTTTTVGEVSADLPAATLVYADEAQTIVAGIDEKATGFDVSKPFEVVIPDGVTEIGSGAFMGYESLVKISFGNYSKLETIGDFAFGGTGLIEVVLPSSVTTIGEAAFANSKSLVAVTLPDGLKEVGDGAFGNEHNMITVNLPDNVDTVYGEYVFDGNCYLVANSRASYVKLKDAANLADYAGNLTYVITIEYDYLGDVIDTEYKLYGKEYIVVLQGKAWVIGDASTLGTSITSSMTWYADEKAEKALQVSDITAVLTDETFADESIRIYAYDKGDTKVFFARNDLVYDGKEYGLNELNSLLYGTSDKITPLMTATIKSFTDADGVVIDSDSENYPKTVGRAGHYVIALAEDSSVYEFDINIARATVDLGDYTNVLSWKLIHVGDTSVNSELRSGSGMTLYIYTYYNGGEYPSRELLSDAERAELGVGDDYEVRFVRYSVVRYRGKLVAVGIAGGMISEAFTVDRYTGNEQTNIGVYTATATISASDNYNLVLNGLPAEGAARGITINVGDDGRSATVTKIWYIVDIGNYAVTDNGGEYTIANRTYGDAAVVSVPKLMYGDVNAADYGSAADPVSLTLTLNGNVVGNQYFTRDRFTQYINDVMPAGEYRLYIYARSVNSYDFDDDGVEQVISHSAFEEIVTFTVNKREMPTLISNSVDRLILGKEFTYVYDGSAHYYYDDVASDVNAALAQVATISRYGTVWDDSRYDEFYGVFAIVFNLSRMQNDEYYSAANMPVRTSDPDRYTVFYKVSAPNYFDSTEGDVRTDYYFTVVNVMEVALPTLGDKTYNGTILTADITDNLVYTVTSNIGGIHSGEYDVELTLRQPEFYMWQGQTLNDKTDKITVKFSVLTASNRWDTDPSVTFWVEGKYDSAENSVNGKPLYGTAVIIITDSKDNVVFDSSKNINDLASLKAGTYRLSATVAATADYDALSYSVFVTVFEKPGLPWWGILAIVVGALLIAAIIILILWKKGVFQILTGKLVLAIRTKATVDATIAAVRASKIAEQSRASRAEAEARDKAEERAQARREALEAERAKSNDEKAAELEAKAQAEVERANQIMAKATAMQERAAAMKEPAEEAPAPAPTPKKSSKKSKKAAEPVAKAESAATDEAKADTAADAAAKDEPVFDIIDDGADTDKPTEE